MDQRKNQDEQPLAVDQAQTSDEWQDFAEFRGEMPELRRELLQPMLYGEEDDEDEYGDEI